MADDMQEYQRRTFESIKQVDENGNELWSARQLAPLLGYKEWRYFARVVKKAREAAANSGAAVDNHFGAGTIMVSVGSGAEVEIEDVILTRYAAYLVAQNGNPRLPEIAEAQTYFAVQTHKQETFEKLGPEAQRLMLRNEVLDNNKRLASTAKKHGVVNFGAFHNKGYEGLYGMGIKRIEQRKMLGRDKLLDRAGNTELAANLFRITQTEDVLAREAAAGQKRGQAGAEGVHFNIGRRVRQTIIENTGTLPEDMNPERETIKQLERRLKAEDKKKLSPAEKPLTIEGGFDATMSKIAKAKPPKDE